MYQEWNHVRGNIVSFYNLHGSWPSFCGQLGGRNRPSLVFGLWRAATILHCTRIIHTLLGRHRYCYHLNKMHTTCWFNCCIRVSGPALIVSVVSLLANVLLIGGARQLSKDFLLVWVVWKSIAICIFWLWFGYNQLKHYGYIDWTRYGMRGCLFCDLNPESTYVGKE